jgi:hypothetical protein
MYVVSVCELQLLNHLADFNDIWYERYDVGV